MPSLIKRGFISKLYKEKYAYRIDICFGEDLFKDFPDEIFKVLFDIYNTKNPPSRGTFCSWMSLITSYCDKTFGYDKWAVRSGVNKNKRTIILWFVDESDADSFENIFKDVIMAVRKPHSPAAQRFMLDNNKTKILVRKTLFWRKYRFRAALKFSRDNIEKIKDAMYTMTEDQLLCSSGWPDTVYLDNDDSATFFMTGFADTVDKLEKVILTGEISE
jgi:hypothetical protein